LLDFCVTWQRLPDAHCGADCHCFDLQDALDELVNRQQLPALFVLEVCEMLCGEPLSV